MSRRLHETAARYDAAADSYRRFWAPVLGAFSRPLLEQLPPDGIVLDLGCGPALLADDLRAARVVGVDLSEEMLRAARIPVVRGDVERIPFADASFDVAISTFMLQHVPFPGRVFGEAARVLRPGGTLGTITWAAGVTDRGGPWDVAWEVLEEARAPEAEPSKAWHHRVDEPDKITRYARAARFGEVRAWTERTGYRWTREDFLGWVPHQRVFGRRLDALTGEQRARARRDPRARRCAARRANGLAGERRVLRRIERRLTRKTMPRCSTLTLSRCFGRTRGCCPGRSD